MAMIDEFPGGERGRRRFLEALGKGSLGAALGGLLTGGVRGAEVQEEKGIWRPDTGRKLRVGIAGHGFGEFGAALGFQDHPNVEVVAVTDLVPERRAAMMSATRCGHAYESLEALLRDRRVEAMVVATDSPNHARHAIAALDHGKHVLCAPPAVFGTLAEAAELVEAVRRSGKIYMMAESRVFRADCHAMRTIYRAGGFGRLLNAEGSSHHYTTAPIASWNGWRTGMPPLWDPSALSAWYVGVTGKRLLAVSCLGTKGRFPEYKPGMNRYGNPFADEVALFETSEGGSVRLAKGRSVQGCREERGRVAGELGWMEGMSYHGALHELPDVTRPALPPALDADGRDSALSSLVHEFVSAVLEGRRPLVDVHEALAMTVPGVTAHESAMQGGERLLVPQFDAA